MTLAETLAFLLPPNTELRFGELYLTRDRGGVFAVRHRDDRKSEDGLEIVENCNDLRELAKFDSEGEYRPLKTAPTLRSGWVTKSDDAAEFLARLDAIYPAVFATWISYEKGELDAISLRDTLNRQTGMYKFAGSITDQMANEIMRSTCAKGCVRLIAWPIENDCPVSRLKAAKGTLPVICTEACTFAVSEARRLAKEAYEKANAT
jgi:sirohydrochlorin cobaltochelatase